MNHVPSTRFDGPQRQQRHSVRGRSDSLFKFELDKNNNRWSLDIATRGCNRTKITHPLKNARDLAWSALQLTADIVLRKVPADSSLVLQHNGHPCCLLSPCQLTFTAFLVALLFYTLRNNCCTIHLSFLIPCRRIAHVIEQVELDDREANESPTRAISSSGVNNSSNSRLTRKN